MLLDNFMFSWGRMCEEMQIQMDAIILPTQKPLEWNDLLTKSPHNNYKICVMRYLGGGINIRTKL